MSDNEPEIKLIQTVLGNKPCNVHNTEGVLQLYNSPLWEMVMVATDKIKFTCVACKTERVYQLMPEKTKLNK